VVGQFEEVRRITHLSQYTVDNKIALIPHDNKYTDTEVWIYDDEDFTREQTINLPLFQFGDISGYAHGRYVFFSSDGASIHVIVQSDDDLGVVDDYGVVTLDYGTGA